MGGGGGAGGDWGGGHFGAAGSSAHRRAVAQMTEASEAMLKEKGLEVPVYRKWNWGSFFCGLFLGLLIGLIFWELT
jgi:hypothetical protein